MIGLGEKRDVRESEWHITAASEVMAILALADDLQDLRARLGRVIVAENYNGEPVTLERAQGRGRDDRADARGDQAEPRPDARGRAGVHPCRARSPTSPTATRRSSPIGSRSSWSTRS